MGPATNTQGQTSPPYTSDPYEQERDKKVDKLNIKNLTVQTAITMLEKVIKTDIVPFLWGPPGVGKSSLVRELAERNKLKFIDLRLSLLNPVDLRGLPVVDKENKTAEWYSPSFLPRVDDKDAGILFLDEINLAPMSTQSAAYQLILDKQLGEYKFPKTWKIIAAGNRETDRANVYKISAPLANRFIHFNIVPDLSAWKKWAGDRIREEIIDFIYLRPHILLQMPRESEKAFPSPRSWEFLSTLLDSFSFSQGEEISDEIKSVVISTIGEPAGKEFIAFLSDYNIKEISKVVDNFLHTGKIKMPKSISMRYAVMMSVYEAYRSLRLNPKWYGDFMKSLSAEEQKTIEEFEKDNQADLNAKFGRAPAIDTYENPFDET